MTATPEISFVEEDLAALAETPGIVAVIVMGKEALTPAAAAADQAMGGGLARLRASKGYKGAAGDIARMPFPAGMEADALLVVSLGDEPDGPAARKAGAALAKAIDGKEATIFAGGLGEPALAAEIAFGLALRTYDFNAYRSAEADEEDDEEENGPGAVTLTVDAPEAVSSAAAEGAALAEGVHFTRDLVNEPANVLTTEDFAARLAAMQELGLEVEVLEEPELEELGMRTLLAVGRGSASPSRVVVMKWSGGGDEPPFAFIGKGVVFDTGGISIKPAAGMEDMTMDMGGAGVVAGVMRALALRQAKANVVGIVGLVENMPDGKAQRPGDIVKSMKGDTIEVINTDAEGRLVLADVLWYAQERFKPAGMLNLATLTGAMIVALGHEYAGYFSNSDELAGDFAKAAEAAGEKAWRLPLDPAYDKLLKSRLADMKNVGGRTAGSITAAQFLKRFVRDETPWIHIDIAGVALVKEDRELSPKGATGWGVLALNRLIRDKYEG